MSERHSGAVSPSGTLGLQVFRGMDQHQIAEQFNAVVAASHYPARSLSVAEIAHYGLPRKGIDERVNAWRTANVKNLWRGARRVLAARALRLPHFYGALYLTHIKADGEVLELGLASMRVVTTAGVNFIVDAFQNTQEVENFKYHGLGTNNTAEAVGDTGLNTELTTQYNPDNTRATGSLTEGASANIFRTVGTNTVDATAAVVEHGILTQAATGGGTLLDRSVFSTVNLASGDSLQSTYDLTIASGG
jgi:hypothetical protein